MTNNIFVINLDKDISRLEKTTKLLKENNISFQRFPAIYGKNLSNDDINKYTTFLSRNFILSYSVLGCALSHIFLWKKLLNDKNNDYYVIFEDDITYFNKIAYEELIQNLPNIDYDYISLFCLTCLNVNKQQSFKNFSLFKNKNSSSAAGYIINKKGAKKAVDYFEKNKINFHIDASLNFIKDFEILVTYPYIIEAKEYDSTVQPKLKNITSFFLSKRYNWFLSNNVICINMKYPIPLFIIIAIIILVLNKLFIKSKFLQYYLLIDILITIYFLIN